MNLRWIMAVFTFLAGALLWFIDFATDASSFGTLPKYVATLLPASFIAYDLCKRYLPVTPVRYINVILWLLNVVVLISVTLVNSVDTNSTVVFPAVLSAMWGTVILVIGLTLSILGLGLGMARNYNRVKSGVKRSVGSVLIAIGGTSILLPLSLLPTYEYWPLIVLPALVIATLGQVLLSSE